MALLSESMGLYTAETIRGRLGNLHRELLRIWVEDRSPITYRHLAKASTKLREAEEELDLAIKTLGGPTSG